MLKFSFFFIFFLFSSSSSSFSFSSTSSPLLSKKLIFNHVEHSSSSAPSIFLSYSSKLTSLNNNKNKSFNISSLKSSLSSSSSSSSSNSSQSLTSSSNSSQLLTSSTNLSIQSILLASWGILQVFCMLFNGMRRMIKPALSPFIQLINNSGKNHQKILLLKLSKMYWFNYFFFIICMIYYEGYVVFYKKVSHKIVSRSFLLLTKINETNQQIKQIKQNHNNLLLSNYIVLIKLFVFNLLRILLSGLFCMSMFDDTPENITKSWIFAIFIATLSYILRSIPLTYRSIIDAGAVCGLSVGMISIFIQFLKRINQTKNTNI